MSSAIVLLRVEKQLINEFTEKIVEIDGVSEVYSVAGQFDLVAVVPRQP